MNKKDSIATIQKRLECKKGFPQMPYLMKLTESELFNLMANIIFNQEFKKDSPPSRINSSKKVPSKDKMEDTSNTPKTDKANVCDNCGFSKQSHTGVGLRWTCWNGKEFKPSQSKGDKKQ